MPLYEPLTRFVEWLFRGERRSASDVLGRLAHLHAVRRSVPAGDQLKGDEQAPRATLPLVADREIARPPAVAADQEIIELSDRAVLGPCLHALQLSQAAEPTRSGLRW